MSIERSNLRIAVLVDAGNLARNGGYGIRYDVLRQFASRDHSEVVRLNVYVMHDTERGGGDSQTRSGQHSFHSMLRDFGYKVIQKGIRWHTDDAGSRIGRSSVDMELALDALIQADRVDRVLLVTGDGDFARLVKTIQDKGCRVEVLGFDNVADSLRHEADLFVSGYLVPDLLPASPGKGDEVWGTLGSRVRGICYHHTDRGFGFLRFLKTIGPDLWKTDSRRTDSPYGSVFFHDSKLPEDFDPEELPSREAIFEFDLVEADRDSDNLQADNIQLVGARRRNEA